MKKTLPKPYHWVRASARGGRLQCTSRTSSGCCSSQASRATLNPNLECGRQQGVAAVAQVADFQWVPQQPGKPWDPFTMVSVSDNGVGGTLQLWRINDMIWLPEDVVLAELEEHRCPPLPYFQDSSPI